jgi:hypothetical protein
MPQNRTVNLPFSWSGLFRAGSVSALIYVVLVIVPILLVFTTPQPPASGGAAVLTYIASNRLVYYVELVCFVGLSVPALVVFLALGAALKDVNKSWAALGSLVGIVSEGVALATGGSPQSLHGGLVLLSDQYMHAAGDAQRSALAGAADGLVAVVNAVSAAGILTAAGILILSLVMLKAPFRRGVPWVGIAAGAIGIISEAFRPVIGAAYGLYGVLLPAWFVLVGLELQRAARRS